MQQKIKELRALLIKQKAVFQQFAQFQTVLEVPQQKKSQYFDKNYQQIVKRFANIMYKQKQIDKDNITMDFMQWLESGQRFSNVQSNQALRHSIPISPQPIMSQIVLQAQTAATTPISRPYQQNPPYIPLIREQNRQMARHEINDQKNYQQYLDQRRQKPKENYQKSQKEKFLNNLSQCFTFSEKRHYVMNQMHPRTTTNKKF